MTAALSHIAVLGDGLAGTLCALALARKLPNTTQLTLVRTPDGASADPAFGTVATPSFYEFLLGLGLQEPDLMLKTRSAFSLGTLYLEWGSQTRSWAQVYQHTLPIYDGVGFHHFITRRQQAEPNTPDLDAHLMAVQAARRGVFAHPPEDNDSPLAEVDYGYHVLPQDLTRWLDAQLSQTRVKIENGQIAASHSLKDTLTSVELDTGPTITADLFIDTVGAVADQSRWSRERDIAILSSVRPRNRPAGVCRQVRPKAFGWQADTPLRETLHRLSVCHPDQLDLARAGHGDPAAQPLQRTIGRLLEPWARNVLAFGQVASCASPVTAAPLLLLQREIDRLVELIPVTSDMTIERREYNRRFVQDFDHTSMFAQALLQAPPKASSAFWDTVHRQAIPHKLADKITQYEGRGGLLQYDYEPFSITDWTVLHAGLGRRPRRYDPLADRLDPTQIAATLDRRRDVFAKTADKMPPHDVYLGKFLDYLRRKHG